MLEPSNRSIERLRRCRAPSAMASVSLPWSAAVRNRRRITQRANWSMVCRCIALMPATRSISQGPMPASMSRCVGFEDLKRDKEIAQVVVCAIHRPSGEGVVGDVHFARGHLTEKGRAVTGRMRATR